MIQHDKKIERPAYRVCNFHLGHPEDVGTDAEAEEKGGCAGARERRAHDCHLAGHGNIFVAEHDEGRHTQDADEGRHYRNSACVRSYV